MVNQGRGTEATDTGIEGMAYLVNIVCKDANKVCNQSIVPVAKQKWKYLSRKKELMGLKIMLFEE